MTRPPPAPAPPAARRIASLALFGSAREIVIMHAGQEYRLRITRTGKLILTKVEEALDEGVRRVVSLVLLADTAFQAEVIRRLLLVIEEEYEEGIAEGRVVLEIECQDAYGFLRRAQTRWASLRRHAGLTAQRRDAIDSAFRSLRQAMPGIHSPASPVPVDQVAALLRTLDTALASVAADRRRETR